MTAPDDDGVVRETFLSDEGVRKLERGEAILPEHVLVVPMSAKMCAIAMSPLLWLALLQPADIVKPEVEQFRKHLESMILRAYLRPEGI